MSEENVEIVRRHIDAYLAGDYKAAIAAYDPEIEYDVSIRPEGRVYRGHAGIVEALRTWAGTWDEWKAEIEEIIDAGDDVLVFDHQTGRGKGSGVPLDQHTSMIYSLREGKIVRVTWFRTRREGLEAVGLSE
jgi:ketosteroid isomerase-like protein